MEEIATEIGALSFDPSVGNIPRLNFRWQGKTLTPLHRAAWTDDADALADEAVPPVDRKLAGDFVCMPFGKSDVEDAPQHGWTANSAWDVHTRHHGWLEATLKRPVMGARITKKLSLKANAPLLVQVHTIDGGEGELTFAHHPMIDVSGGARLTCSAKRVAMTNDFAIVPGRHAFTLGESTSDLTAIPGSDGEAINLHKLPIPGSGEDFITLVDEASEGLGWTAVIREREDDIVFVLKDLHDLPITMLWHSNGARTDFPWNGRNRGVLGIEDGRSAAASGHKAAIGDNPIKALGVPTTFKLAEDRRTTIRHVIGAIPNAQGWNSVQSIVMEKHAIAIEGDHGDTVRVPFHDYHLFGRAAPGNEANHGNR